MNKQGNVLNKEKYIGAPIERAHLHRGFNSKKTPIKWIRFFRACVLQRQVAEEKKRKKFLTVKITFGFLFGLLVLLKVLNFSEIYEITILDKVSPVGIFFIGIALLVIATVIFGLWHKDFNQKFAKGFDFFADYFSAFFTLIEEDLQPQSKIALEANLKDTRSNENLLKKEKYEAATRGFISGKQNYYERAISKGACFFSDGSLISFQFTERMRERIVKKRGQVSRKTKTKYKFKTVYPFTLKMKIPKDKYVLNASIDKEQINLAQEENFYVFKAVRKFDTKKENPEFYNPYDESSISSFAVDYFSLELINLINTCYSCVLPRA